MTGKALGLWFGKRVVLESSNLLQVENELSELAGTYLDYVCGIFSTFEKILECVEGSSGYTNGIVAFTLCPGAELVALD